MANHFNLDFTFRGQQYKASGTEYPGTPFSWHIFPYNKELTEDFTCPIIVVWNKAGRHYEHTFHPVINAVVEALRDFKGEEWKPFNA